MQDERALLEKNAGRIDSLGPVEAFMLTISRAPRAGQRLQAARLQRSFAERLECSQVSGLVVTLSLHSCAPS